MKNTKQRDVQVDPVDRDDRDEEVEGEKHEGDVLGLGPSNPDVRLPKPATSRKRPRGIDVIRPATGIGDVPQRTGATGIDMGYGGQGTQIDPSSDSPVDDNKDE